MTEETDRALGGRDQPAFDTPTLALHRASFRREEPYRALVELTSDAVYCFAFDPPIDTQMPVEAQIAALNGGVLADCNDACARLYGVDGPEAVLGRPLAALLPVENPSMQAVFRSFIENGYRMTDAESVGTSRRDGRVRHYVNSATGLLVDGRLERMWGTWRDVTARYVAEARIRQSEARLNAAQRLARIGSWEIDHGSEIFLWSDEVYRIFDVDPASFVPRLESFMARVHPNDRALIEDAYETSLRTREPYAIEHRIVMDDGSIKYVSERCEMLFDDAGQPLRSIGTIQDITERKHTQATIDELMARLEALTSVAFDGIAISEKGVLRECSTQLADALGYSAAEIIGQPILGFVAPAFRLTAHDKLAGEAVEPFEIRMLRKDGTTLPVEVVRATIDIRDTKLRVYGLRDITRRKELQSQLIAISEDERHRIGRDLHDGLGQLLFGASLSLRSVCDQLEESGSSLLPTVRQIKDIIVEAIDETRRVSHLLVPTIYERNNLSVSLSQLVATVDGVSGIRFSVECQYDCALPNAGTAEQLYRITQECISNALKHSRASEVSVRLYTEDDLLHLEVVDDGVGLSSEDAEQPAGLGIRSMHYRASLIDGSLEILPGQDGGTRIVCRCPL